MGAGTDKQIKLSIVVDQNSAKAAKALVDDLYRSVERLQVAASKVNIGGGGVTSRPADRSVAGGSTGVQRPGSGPGQKGGVIQSVLGIGDAGALRGLISGTEQAFQRIGADIRSFVDKAESDLKRLRSAVASVGAGGGPAGSGGGGRGGGSETVHWPVPAGQSYVWGQDATPRGGKGRAGGVAGGGGGPGIMGGIGQVGQEALGSAGLGWVGRGVGALGLSTAGAVVGGLGVAAIGGLIYAGGARQSNVMANLGADIGVPIQYQSGLGAAAGTSRGAYQAGRHLDMRYVLAYRTAMNDRASIEAAVNTDARRELALREANQKGLTTANLAKSIRSGVGAELGGQEHAAPVVMGFSPMGGAVVSSSPTIIDSTVTKGRRSANDIERDRIEREIPGRVDAAVQERIQADLATQGRFADVAQYAASSWQGNLSTRRMGRMGPGRRPDGSVMDPAEWALSYGSSLERRGRTLEDVAGARRSIMGGMGVGYLSRVGAEGILGMHEGGAVGVEGIGRAAGVLGGMGSGAAFGGLQSSIGRGGLDELAGSELFGQLYQRSVGLSSQFGYGGNTASTFVRGAAGLVSGGGGDVAEQQARSMMLGRGLGEWAGTTSGKTAPLYQAYSVLSSMRAAGGFGALSEKLRETDPSVLAAVARGGDAPAWMRSLLQPGQSASGVASSFLKQDRRAPFFESYGALAPAAGTPAAALLAKVRGAEASGGDFTDVVKGELRGLRGAARGRRVDEINQVLGTTAIGGAEGLFAREVADPELAPFLRAHGAHGQGPAGTERAAAGASADQKAADAGLFAKGGDKTITEVIKSSAAVGAAGEAMLKTLRGLQGLGLGAAAGEVSSFVAALREATAALRGVSSGMARGR